LNKTGALNCFTRLRGAAGFNLQVDFYVLFGYLGIFEIIRLAWPSVSVIVFFNIIRERSLSMEIQISTRPALMLCFYNKQIFHEKSYSWMSLAFILKQLREFHNIDISVSGLKWQLKKLEDLGFMTFYKNNCGRRSDGTIYRRPSNRMLTVKGLLWLRAHGLKIAGWLWDHVARIKKLSRGKSCLPGGAQDC